MSHLPDRCGKRISVVFDMDSLIPAEVNPVAAALVVVLLVLVSGLFISAISNSLNLALYLGNLCFFVFVFNEYRCETGFKLEDIKKAPLFFEGVGIAFLILFFRDSFLQTFIGLISPHIGAYLSSGVDAIYLEQLHSIQDFFEGSQVYRQKRLARRAGFRLKNGAKKVLDAGKEALEKLAGKRD